MVLVGLVLIALAVLGGVILLTDDGGGSNRTGAQPAAIELPTELGESLDNASSGISVSWPSEWTKREKGGVFAFQSPDKTVVLAISAPAGAADADQLRRDAIASAASGYKKPAVRPGKGRTIGGLRAEGAIISGQGPSGESRSLIAVAPGRQKAYLLEVLTADGAPSERLVEAQLILNSLRLSR
jgi:hypothetical protein